MKNFTKVLIGAFLAFAVLASTTNAAMTWSRSLKLGVRGADVKDLQMFLNMCADTKVSNSGAGSPGMETTYFGPATRAAVIKWQAARGVSPQSGLFGPLSRAKAAELQASSNVCGGGVVVTPPNQTGPVMASLANDNPASGTLVAGQATADLAHFTFSGTGVVTNVTLQRIGVSADTTPSNVYLFDGATRLTDAASVSNNGMVTFNVPAGIFTVNGLKTISVKADIAASTAGQTVGFKLSTFATAAGVMTANLSGNIHSIASATLATVTAGTVTPSGATLNPGSNVTLWQSTLTISNRDVWMKRIALRNVGSAPASAFQNFKLYVNGVQVGTAAGLDINGYVTFDLSAAPVSLISGSRVVRVDADVVSGASRTVQLSLRNAADVDFVDSSFGVNVSPTATPWAAAAASTISGTSGGTLTIEKDVSSPSANVTLSGSDTKIAVYKVTAYGEPIKIENIRATFTASNGAVGSLRNGRIMIGGSQYGSTSTLNEDSQATPYTSYTLNYTVMPGTPVMLALHADIYDNDGTNSLVANDTIIGVLAAGSSNAQRMDSLGSFSAPSSAVSGNTLTAKSASAALTKNGTYANQTVVLPSTNTKIGSWNLAGSTVEDLLLTTLSFDIDESVGTEFDEGDITNIYAVVKDSMGNVVAQPSPLSTAGTGADLNFSVNYTLVKNANLSIELFANLSDDGLDMVAGVSGGSNAIDSTDAFVTDLTVTGTALTSGTAVTATSADTAGQVIAYGAASITATLDASASSASPAAIVYDNQTVTAAPFKFAAVTSGYNITDLTFTLADASVAQNVMLYDGNTLVATQPGASTVTFSGLNWNVPANTNKVLTARLQLGAVGIGAGTTGSSQLLTLTDFIAVNTSTGVSAAGTESNPAGNAMYAYAATPTITNLALPTTILSTGTVTAAKFSVASNGGTIGWKKFIFTVTRAMSGTDTLATPTLWDYDTNTQVAGVAAFTGSVEADGGTSGTITFVATTEQQVSGTKNYVLKLVTAGTLADGDNLNVSIAQPSSYVAPAAYATVAATTSSFTWTDTSASSHDETTLDWSNGYLVKNLPTDTQTLIK